MRIVFYVEFYYPRIGGAEKVVQMVAEHMATQGAEAHVVTTGESFSQESINGVFVTRFPVSGNLAKGIRGDLEPVRRHIAALSPDLVFVYALQTWGSDLFLTDRSFLPEGCKVVLVPCGLSALSSLPRRILYHRYFKLLKKNLRAFDCYVFHTKCGNDYRFYQPLLEDDCAIIPNAAAEDVRTWTREQAVAHLESMGLGHLVGQRLILNVSNHYALKGHAPLIEIFRRTFPEGYRLVIAGTKPTSGQSCYDRCRASAEGSPDIELVDGKDRRTVLSLYRVATLFFLSSSIEYFPLVLLEAQAVGLPFISFPVGNATELAGGKVTRPRDYTREGMAAFLADEAGLRALGENGRREVEERYTEARVLEAYRGVFERMANA